MEARVDENTHDSLAALRGVQEGDRVPCRGGDGREHEQNGRSEADWDDKGQSHAYQLSIKLRHSHNTPGRAAPAAIAIDLRDEGGEGS
jgi:hypothetical protein